MMNILLKHTTAKLIFIGFMITASHWASAQNEGRWYSVEVLIFKRLNTSSLTDEFWPQDNPLQYPAKLQYISKGATEDISLKQNFKRLSPNVFHLNNHRESLRRSKDYEVLYHQGWQQQMQGKDKSPSIAIQGGKPIGNSNAQSHSELEGYITFHIARYLHINTNLWLSEPSVAKLQGASSVSPLPDRPLYGDAEEQDLSQALKNDVVPAQPLSERIGERLARNTSRLIEGASDFNEKNNDYDNVRLDKNTSKGIVALSQHRRMRSKELHYIDHPLMGVLIYINPVPEE